MIYAIIVCRVKNVFSPKPLEDTTLFVDVLQRTELFGECVQYLKYNETSLTPTSDIQFPHLPQ